MWVAIGIVIIVIAIILYLPKSTVVGGGGSTKKPNTQIIKDDNIYLISLENCPACDKQKNIVLAKNTITGKSRADIINKMNNYNLDSNSYDISKVPVWINSESGKILVGVQTKNDIINKLN